MPPKKAAAAPLDLFSNPRDELPKAPGEGSGVYQPGRGGINSDRWGKNSGGGFDSERRSGGFDRDSGFRGAGPREGGFRSGGDREGGFRGGDREGGFRGGDREGGFRSGGDREGGFRGGDREGGFRSGGFDRDGGARGGFDRDGGARGGFDRDGGARGGFDRDSREGGFRGRGGDDADSGRSENAQWRRPVDNARPADSAPFRSNNDSAPYRSNDSAAWRRPADADSEPRGGDRFQSRESSTPSPAPASSSSGAPAPVKYRPPGMRDNAESAPADRDSFAPPSSPGWKDPRSGPDRFARGAGGDRPFGGDREGGFRSGGDRGFGGDREGGFRSGGDRGFGGDREGGFRSGGDRFGGDRGSGDRFGGDRSFGGDRRSGFGGGFGSSSSTRTQVPLGTRRQYGSRAGEGAESDRNQNAFSELANDGSGSMPNSPAAGRFQQSGGQRLGKSAAAAAREAEEAEAAAAVKAQADEELAKRNEAVDDNVVVFSKDDLVSELQTALADSTEVTEDILASGLAQLTLSPDTKTDLTRALVKSLGAQPPLPLRAVIDIAQSQKPEEATSIVLSLLSAYQAAKDKAAVEDIIARSKMTNEQVFEALCGNLPAAQQDALLTQNNLMFLKPRPADLLATVTKALDDGVAPAEIVKQIDAAVGAVVVPSECLPVATERALAAVFEGAPASYTAATADKLDPFLPLLARLTRGDKQAQIQLVFSVQEKWFAAGKAKGLGKALLMKLAQSGEPKVVSPHALMAWREDITDKRSKAPSKGSLILQTSAWLSEMEKTLEPEADEDEEEDEDLPTNPNAEFF